MKRHVVFIDKPKGLTSFDVVERVGQTLGFQKAGHTGTLDPNVTGLMLIALGESRKAMPVLIGLDKEYEGTMLLHKDVEKKDIEKAFKKFTGEIIQLPPVRSRVARKERKRTVHFLKIKKIDKREVHFVVNCQAGTYIRKLVHDIGEFLSCGAHMAWLRRTKIGPFDIKQAVELSKVSAKDMVELEKILKKIDLKSVEATDEAIQKIRNGSPLFPEYMTKKADVWDDEVVGIFDKSGNIIALGRASGKKIKTSRVFN